MREVKMEGRGMGKEGRRKREGRGNREGRETKL